VIVNIIKGNKSFFPTFSDQIFDQFCIGFKDFFLGVQLDFRWIGCSHGKGRVMLRKDFLKDPPVLFVFYGVQDAL